MPVEIVGGVERQEGADTHRERPQHIIDDVEVKMRVAGALRRHDTPVRIIDRELRLYDPVARPLLHAFEHVVDPRSAFSLQTRSQRGKLILLAHVLLRPAHGNVMVVRIGVDPAQILIGSLPERFLANTIHLLYRTEEVHDVLRSPQRREVSANHDAVKAVIGKTN